jgi:hypothetical protein
LKEVSSSRDDVVTERLVRFPFCPVIWWRLGKLWGHEDVFDDQAQDIRIDMSGSGVHECMEDGSLDEVRHSHRGSRVKRKEVRSGTDLTRPDCQKKDIRCAMLVYSCVFFVGE